MVAEKSDYISPELKSLAWKAMRMRRADIENKKRPFGMKTYFERALRGAGIGVTEDRLAKMGSVAGKAGGEASARKRREREQAKEMPASPGDGQRGANASPSRFRETLWPNLYK